MEASGALTQDRRVSRLAAVVVALCACHKAPPRIYTDAEIATLEKRVLDEVAKTDASCPSHQELLDIATAIDEPCRRVFEATHSQLDTESNEIASVDDKCSARVIEAFGRAASTSPGCSPYQVGVRTEFPVMAASWDKRFRQYIDSLHAARILAWHALRETDDYVGLTELLLALDVAQDMGRGRVDLLEGMKAASMEKNLVSAAEKLLSQSSLTHEQLVDATATLDATMAREPSFSAALQGEALSMALHVGVAALKPIDWQPPGGRTELTTWKGARPASNHDSRDDAAALMEIGLRRIEADAKACPPSSSLATCHANLAATDSPTNIDEDFERADKQAARVAMFPDDVTRRQSQEQLVAASIEPEFLEDYVGRRAVAFSHVVALRLRLQVLLDGHCPSEAELTAPPWSTLRAPALLGDSVVVTRTADALLVNAPTWATIVKFAAQSPPFPPALPKPPPVTIPCP